MGGAFGKGDSSTECITETKLETKMVEAMQRRAFEGSSLKSFNSIILKFLKIDESLRKCKDIFEQFGFIVFRSVWGILVFVHGIRSPFGSATWNVFQIQYSSTGESMSGSKTSPPTKQATEICLWEKLSKAAMMDIESSSFSWDMLSSLHHTEHNTSTEQSEDEMNRALEERKHDGNENLKYI